MRARTPGRQSVVQRDCVRVAFGVNGHGEPALLLIPASPITHARSWQGIVPFLVRRYTVIMADGPVTGRSDFFRRQQLPEPHSTKQYDDTVGWALDINEGAMIAQRKERAAPPAREAEAPGRRMRCPVRALHGCDDCCQPVAHGRRLAGLTGGDLVVLEGAGHLAQSWEPVRVTRPITEFAARSRERRCTP